MYARTLVHQQAAYGDEHIDMLWSGMTATDPGQDITLLCGATLVEATMSVATDTDSSTDDISIFPTTFMSTNVSMATEVGKQKLSNAEKKVIALPP
jgi:hypothetical protein